ncbi:MAG TPA: carbamoyltransferase C-terminal domain-containing protein [Smithellaceae bacterium]|nr:carbamoyltransferase C-terminal domain-containing protein [Smithellaceae bacterium]
MSKLILGIWDGHDSGAALLQGDEIKCLINEERLTRRKLEIAFPRRSIAACLQFAGVRAADISLIAVCTTDPAKTLTRLFPSLKEEYYLIRRRKKMPRPLDPLRKSFKYRFTELSPNFISTKLSRAYLHRQLQTLGFHNYDLHLIDHHQAHAEAAAGCCGFPDALVVTLDGVGDGLCGSMRVLKNGHLSLLRKFPAGSSPGIFFEHVTNLLNMRELEDEGKVMALANYAYPVPDAENPLLNVIQAKDGRIISIGSSTAQLKALKKILWNYPSEQFSFMAQRALEKTAVDLVDHYLQKTGLRHIAAAGGVFSNIKMNMALAELPRVEDVYVFPHMGDGGLAVGAAMAVNREKCGIAHYDLKDIYLGPAFTHQEITAAVAGEKGIKILAAENPQQKAAELILKGEVILWFCGRMEAGPRSLGNRSILARPDDRGIKDRLNLILKKRVWYQPFCPSILAEDAAELLELDGRQIGSNPFMTMAFRVRKEHRRFMEGVINIDGTCRPHFVRDENPAYRDLLLAVKKELGWGVVLNTSFNIHGEPLVCSPAEAVKMMKQSGIAYLFMEDLIIENQNAEQR